MAKKNHRHLTADQQATEYNSTRQGFPSAEATNSEPVKGCDEARGRGQPL